MEVGNTEEEIKQAIHNNLIVVVYGYVVTLENDVLWINCANGSGYKARYNDIYRMSITNTEKE